MIPLWDFSGGFRLFYFKEQTKSLQKFSSQFDEISNPTLKFIYLELIAILTVYNIIAVE